MAQTHRENVVEISADQEAWNKAAAGRQFAVDEGRVWLNVGERSFYVDPPKGFAGLDPAIRPLVFQAVCQRVVYRTAQNAAGESMQDAVNKVMSGETIERANTNDALDAAYKAIVADLLRDAFAKLPDDAPAEEKAQAAIFFADEGENATKEQKAARSKLIAEMADFNRSTLYAKAVEKSKRMGREPMPAATTTRKQAKAKPTNLGFKLAM